MRSGGAVRSGASVSGGLGGRTGSSDRTVGSGAEGLEELGLLLLADAAQRPVLGDADLLQGAAGLDLADAGERLETASTLVFPTTSSVSASFSTSAKVIERILRLVFSSARALRASAAFSRAA